MVVVNVCKKYSNSPKKRNYHTKKNAWYLYFYDEDGKFHTKRVSKYKAYYYKLFIKKHKIKRCQSCGQKIIDYCQFCM